MKLVEVNPSSKTLSLWTADKVAYAAVLAGASSLMGDGLFGFSRHVASESAVWFLIAGPMLCLAVYTIISGIYLRREAAGLGEFGAVDSHRDS